MPRPHGRTLPRDASLLALCWVRIGEVTHRARPRAPGQGRRAVVLLLSRGEPVFADAGVSEQVREYPAEGAQVEEGVPREQIAEPGQPVGLGPGADEVVGHGGRCFHANRTAVGGSRRGSRARYPRRPHNGADARCRARRLRRPGRLLRCPGRSPGAR